MDLYTACDIYYNLCSEAKTRADRENVYLPDPLDTLAKYVNAGCYIHFGQHQDLIGINPNYIGPNLQGIYTFALDESMYNKVVSSYGAVKSSRPYIHIIAAKSGNLLDSRSYSQNDLNKDLEILKKSFPEKSLEIEEFGKEKSTIPAKTIMMVVRDVLATTNINLQNKIIKLLGYIGIQDHGDGVLFNCKPPGQTVFLSKAYIDVVDTISNPVALAA